MPGSLKTHELLRQVSRSFFLTLRVLPHTINDPIGIAYLLARASDTIADTTLIQVPRRIDALRQLRASIQQACEARTGPPPDFGDLAEACETIAGEGTSSERILLERFGELLSLFRSLEPDDRLRIGKLLETIICGQENDLLLFGTNSNQVVAFKSEKELDRYTYEVAGCVGEFWTEMCRVRVFPTARINDSVLKANGVLFGKGLQLVNILRDLPKDLRRGRCYIPEDTLAGCGLTPKSLLDPSSMKRFRPLYDIYLKQAETYLSAGWQYTTSLPFRCVRIRLACAWPLLIAVKTLQRLRTANVLDDKCRIKISRFEVRQLMLQSAIAYPFPGIWNRLFARR